MSKISTKSTKSIFKIVGGYDYDQKPPVGNSNPMDAFCPLELAESMRDYSKYRLTTREQNRKRGCLKIATQQTEMQWRRHNRSTPTTET